ncbi:TPA: hypothetical protein ACTEN7_000342 [Legionella pneumophila]
MDTLEPKHLFNFTYEYNVRFIFEGLKILKSHLEEEIASLVDENNTGTLSHEAQIDSKVRIDNNKFLLEDLIITTFLRLYSLLEEFLLHSIKLENLSPDVNVKGLDRFVDALKNMGFNLNSKEWQLLKNASEIRHCLLHANGRVDLMKAPLKTAAIVKCLKNVDIVDVGAPKIIIKDQFLDLFVDASMHFIRKK